MNIKKPALWLVLTLSFSACADQAPQAPGPEASPSPALQAQAITVCPPQCGREPSYRAALDQLQSAQPLKPNSGVIIVPDGGTMNARSTLSQLSGSVLSTLRQTLHDGAWDAPESEAARREGLSALTTFLLSARATLVNGEAQLVATGQQVADLHTVLSGLK